MTGHILLTRPKSDIEQSAAKWQDAGYTVTPCPLTTIRSLAVHDKGHHDTIWLLTSRIAVYHGLLKLAAPHDTVVTAGLATMAHAKTAGFAETVSGGGSGLELFAFVRKHFDTDRPIVHLAGRHIAFDLADELRKAGYDAEHVACYEACAVTSLPGEALNQLRSGKITHVPFYSARALAIFEKLVKSADLSDRLAGAELLAMSPRIADTAALRWKAVRTARKADENSLLKAGG